jgi:hypothetical protein
MKRALTGLAVYCLASGAAAGIPVIRHNDGTVQRLKVGDKVRFAGLVKVGFEYPTSIANYRPQVPAPGAKYDSATDRDFICADLDIPVSKWHSLFKIEGKPVVATGIVAEQRLHPRPGFCPLLLKDVRLNLRSP